MAYTFNNVGAIGYYTNGEQIENSLLSWLEWAFLGIGSFSNITSYYLDVAGNPLNVLKPATDVRYTAGTVWQSMRSQWIWETGVPYVVQPTPVNNVQINGVAASVGSYINYPEGRIVFSSPVDVSSVVTANYSNRYTQIHKSSSPWFQDLQYRSFRSDELDIVTFPENRVQLPCVVVERVNKAESRPYEMGNTTSIYKHEFRLHCLGENDRDCARLHDILINQADNRIPAYDSNKITFPLSETGTPISGAKVYPDLVNFAPWRQIRIAQASSNPMPYISNKLFWGVVRYSLEVDSV